MHSSVIRHIDMSEDGYVTRPVCNFHDNCRELLVIWFISAATFTLSACHSGMSKFFARSLLVRVSALCVPGTLRSLVTTSYCPSVTTLYRVAKL